MALQVSTQAGNLAEVRHLLQTRGAKLTALDLQVDGPFCEGQGCDACRDTGYRGRTGLFELLVMSGGLRELILEQRSSRDIQSAATRDMTTLPEDGFGKVRAGVTTLDEVLRVSMDEAEVA